MIKALLALPVAFKAVEAGSATYQMFHAFGDALFYFLPFILAASAAKRFKCSPYIAAVLAGILMHASLTGLEATTAVLNIFNGNTINFSYVPMFGSLPMLKVSYIRPRYAGIQYRTGQAYQAVGIGSKNKDLKQLACSAGFKAFTGIRR